MPALHGLTKAFVVSFLTGGDHNDGSLCIGAALLGLEDGFLRIVQLEFERPDFWFFVIHLGREPISAAFQLLDVSVFDHQPQRFSDRLAAKLQFSDKIVQCARSLRLEVLQYRRTDKAGHVYANTLNRRGFVAQGDEVGPPLAA